MRALRTDEYRTVDRMIQLHEQVDVATACTVIGTRAEQQHPRTCAEHGTGRVADG